MALLCAYLVVVIHCISTFKVDSRLLWHFGYSGFCRMAVPFFFLASGFFLGRHVDEAGWWRREVVKRCRSLLVPAFFWLSLFFLYRVVFLVLAGRGVELDLKGVLAAFGFDFFDYPVLRPLWFVRTLFLLVLASPLVVWLVRGVGVLPLFLLFPWEDPFFFAIGMASGMRRVDFRMRRRVSACVLLIGVGLMLCCGFCSENHVVSVRWLGRLSLPFLVLGAVNLVPGVTIPESIALTAFPIYVLHMFIVAPLGAVIRGRCVEIVSSPLVLLSVSGGVFAASMIMAVALRHCLPGWRWLLWGGR